MADLQAVELRDVLDVAQTGHPRIRRCHAQDLIVEAHLVPHPEHPDRPAGDQAAGEGRLIENHQRIKRVTIIGKRVLDKAVVGRIPGEVNSIRSSRILPLS